MNPSDPTICQVINIIIFCSPYELQIFTYKYYQPAKRKRRGKFKQKLLLLWEPISFSFCCKQPERNPILECQYMINLIQVESLHIAIINQTSLYGSPQDIGWF